MTWAAIAAAGLVSWLIAKKLGNWLGFILGMIAGIIAAWGALVLYVSAIESGQHYADLIYTLGEAGAAKLVSSMAMNGLKAASGVAIACAFLGMRKGGKTAASV